MQDESNPTLARRRLAVRLRQARERSGRTLEELAAELGVSLPQASRLDTGARGYKPEQVTRLSDWYSLGAAERALLGVLVGETRRRAWWQQVDLPDSYRTLIGLEQGARGVNEFCASVFPGLLQRPDYARAAVQGSAFEATPALVERAVEVRLRRQALLDATDAPLLWALIDESALARTTGGPRVMADQLEFLLKVSERPRVTLQVVGFEAGTHIGATLHFILLEMRHSLPDVVYAEGRLDPTDTDDVDEVAGYRRRWDLLRALALDERSSAERLAAYLHRL